MYCSFIFQKIKYLHFVFNQKEIFYVCLNYVKINGTFIVFTKFVPQTNSTPFWLM